MLVAAAAPPAGKSSCRRVTSGAHSLGSPPKPATHTTFSAALGRSLYVIGSDGGLLASPVELKQLLIHVGERFEALVDGRDGRAFDIVTLPVAQDIMRLPPFDGPLPLVTIRPEGADGTGQLPSSLAVLPALPQQLYMRET